MLKPATQKLSAREKQILTLAQWCSVEETADWLGIGQGTVKEYRKRAFDKLKVETVNAAIARAVLRGEVQVVPMEKLPELLPRPTKKTKKTKKGIKT